MKISIQVKEKWNIFTNQMQEKDAKTMLNIKNSNSLGIILKIFE